MVGAMFLMAHQDLHLQAEFVDQKKQVRQKSN